MSDLLPYLQLPPGETDPNVAYNEIIGTKEGYSEAKRTLSITKNFLVMIADNPDSLHILENTYVKDREVWLGPEKEEVLEQMFEKGYPRFIFPSWSLYNFWRSGKAATEEQINEGYGYVREGWLDRRASQEGETRPFTAFNAIRRYFEDDHAADHLEIRYNGSTSVMGRAPYSEYERLLSSPGYPPRMNEYASLWLPNLLMDEQSLKWYKELQAERARELEKLQKAQEAQRRAEAWQDIISNSNLGDLSKLDEAA